MTTLTLRCRYATEEQRAEAQWRLQFNALCLYQEASPKIFTPFLCVNQTKRPATHTRGSLSMLLPDGTEKPATSWFLQMEVRLLPLSPPHPPPAPSGAAGMRSCCIPRPHSRLGRDALYLATRKGVHLLHPCRYERTRKPKWTSTWSTRR